MGNNSTVIDYIDLVIPIPASCIESIQRALSQLEEHCTYVEVAPKLKGDSLHINSNDAITLLGFIDPEGLSEFDRARIKRDLMQELDQQLLRSTSLDKQAHYKWCMTAVKNFELGRHLTGVTS